MLAWSWWRCALVGAAVTAAALAVAAERPAGNWPGFRGPNASGTAEGFSLPVAWDVETKRGIRWRTPIAGLGHSSPVVWGDRVYVTSATGGKDGELRVGLYGDIRPVEDATAYQWLVLCLDRKSGKLLWQKTAHTGVPKIQRHPKSTHANPTVATDGKHVVAFFGSEGLYCYDPNGKLLWSKDLGVLDSGFYMVPAAQWGFASSTVIEDGKVIVQCDIQKGSFLAAFDVRDGKEVWHTAREDVPTWGTPTVVREGGRAQVVVNGYRHIGGYDLKTGRELWRMKGGGDIPVPTPIFAHGLIFVTNAHGRQAPIYAVRPAASGDITLAGGETTSSNVAWSQVRDGAYMQTPLVYGDHLYVCRDNGVLFCYEAKTGKRVYQERLGTGATGFTASGVAGDGKLFYTSEEGDVYVVKAGPVFQLLGKNSLGETCLSTPAIAQGTLFFRTRSHLVAVGP
jgi:outer membrane protein assembly factor BamB